MGECVQLRTRILGANHPYTLSSLTVLSRWQTEKSETGAADEGQGML
jgi:hypothetical protein